MCHVMDHLFPGARMKLFLIDDGTLDTLFECPDCGMEERYSSDGIERDEYGNVLPEEMARVSEEHECPTEDSSD